MSRSMQSRNVDRFRRLLERLANEADREVHEQVERHLHTAGLRTASVLQ
jgi:hypothetical protein